MSKELQPSDRMSASETGAKIGSNAMISEDVKDGEEK